jgi:hypothetical protein
MTTLHLGFKAFDLHELACHFMARQAGLYAARGLEVRLLDTNFVPDQQLPPRTFHAACTAALLAWLHGAATKVVFVACERPMFWLAGRPGLAVSGLARGAIAGYPPDTPPAALLQMVLRGLGLDGHRTPVVLPARDDNARLGLLIAGDVDAAVVSSALPPDRVRRRGVSPLAFFGEELRFPTTGLAVSCELHAREPDLVAAMCVCYQQALRLLRGDDAVTRAAITEFLAFTGAEVEEAVALVRRCYTEDGRSPVEVQAFAISAMRSTLGLTAQPAGELYDFSALEHNAGQGPRHERQIRS